MKRAMGAFLITLSALAGCQLLGIDPPHKRPPLGHPTYSEYHLPQWEWLRVDRVLVLPLLNESAYTRAGREIESALTSNLQRIGRFEVVAGPPDDQAVQARLIHRGGRFDESVMLEMGRAVRADVIIHGTITQYSPYPRPRMGIILQAVSPIEAKVVSSVDGIWDTTDSAVAERVRTYYRQQPRAKPPWVRNHVIASDDGFAGELALDSPALFQRFVCNEAVLALLGQPVPGVVVEYVVSGEKSKQPELKCAEESPPKTTPPVLGSK